MIDKMSGSYLKFRCGVDSAIESCANVVKEGGVVVYPTDTVYAMGCDPFNDLAVKRVFHIKQRAPEKAMPVLCASFIDLEKIVRVSNKVKRLARSFWPGPLTIICPLSNRNISPRLISDNSVLAVRIPGNSCALSLLRLSRYLVGTSANISGQQSVKDPSQIHTSSLTNFDALLDGGPLIKYSHSTIVHFDDSETLTIVRNGPISKQDILTALRST